MRQAAQVWVLFVLRSNVKKSKRQNTIAGAGAAHGCEVVVTGRPPPKKSLV